MNRPSRNISRFDYKAYHNTGEKSSKLDIQYRKLEDSLDKDSIMERIQLVDEDKMIVLEIGCFLEENKLEDLYGIEDIEKCVSELKQLKKKFEELHIKLRRVLEEEHEELYKDYDYDVKKIGDWIKEAKREISMRKREKEKVEKEEVARKEKEEKEEVVKKEREVGIKEDEEKEEMVRKVRDKIMAEEKYFGIKVEQFLSNVAEEKAEFIEDIEKNISEVKYLMEVHSELYSRIESEFGEKYEEEFGNYWKTSNSMNKCILDEKQKIKIIRQAEKDKELRAIEAGKDKELRVIEAENKKVLRDKEVEKERNSGQREESKKKYEKKISFIKYMFDEIKASTINLDKRYSISLKSLNDHQVFEKRSDIKIMDIHG